MDLRNDEEKRPDFLRLKHCVETVFEYVSANGKRLAVLEKIIRKRVVAEANFARSLNSIDELEGAEEGSLANALEALSSDLKNQFTVRYELANNLNIDVLAPLAHFRANFQKDMTLAHMRW